MSDRYIHVVRLILAVLALAIAIIGDVRDAPTWATTLATAIATGLALVTRFETVLGTDLDGDGRVGPRAPRLP